MLKQILHDHQNNFIPVVPFIPATDRIAAIDLSAANKAFSGEIVSDLRRFSEYILSSMQKEGALYAIGGYGELRDVYSNSNVFNATGDTLEPRRFHLGVDIWGKALTPVCAPIDGTIHSFAYNNTAGDYGATIILKHNLSGLTFHTLYGHLSLRSIESYKEGEAVVKGTEFAEFGKPEENGMWPPHLHFQIIETMGAFKGDYPGVCRYSERESYLANCPDGDLILSLNRFLAPFV